MTDQAIICAVEIVNAVEWSGDMRANMTRIIGAGRVLEKALAVVTSERDALRDRVHELEAALAAYQQFLSVEYHWNEFRQEFGIGQERDVETATAKNLRKLAFVKGVEAGQPLLDELARLRKLCGEAAEALPDDAGGDLYARLLGAKQGITADSA